MKNRIILSLLTFVFCFTMVFSAFAGKASKGKKPNYTIETYGFLKLDTTYDDSLTDNPDAAKYAVREAGLENEAQFAMTAMNTRLGAKFIGPEKQGKKIIGKVEVDFYDTWSDNSQQIRMRQAYVKLKTENWKLLAGQTWDVFAPLGPNNLNTNGWLFNGGNPGFRRPQIRLTNYFKDKSVKTDVSINRNIGIGTSGVNTGENSGRPVLQARAGYSLDLDGKKATLGVSGLYGEEKGKRWTGTTYIVDQWGIAIDCDVAFNEKVGLKGEVFTGSNLDAVVAGIGQGINTATEKGIDTIGGWAQVTYKKCAKCTINVGAGIDNPDKDTLNNGNRLKNTVVFGNINYEMYEDVNLGLQYENFATEYLNAQSGTNSRATVSVIYKL